MFAIHASSLPSVSTYAQALEVVEKAKPQDGVWKALNPKNRRDTSKRVRQENDKVIFRLHHTDVVTWRGPNDIEIEYHSSLSTSTFIEMLTPLHSRLYRDKLYVEGVRPKKTTVRFYKHEGAWGPDLDDVASQYAFEVDRKRSAAVRKIVKPVIEFRQAYRALRPDLTIAQHGDQTVGRLLDYPPKDDAELMRLLPYLPSDEEILRVALLRSGAVKKVELPVGALPKPSKWAQFAHML